MEITTIVTSINTILVLCIVGANVGSVLQAVPMLLYWSHHNNPIFYKMVGRTLFLPYYGCKLLNAPDIRYACIDDEILGFSPRSLHFSIWLHTSYIKAGPRMTGCQT